MKPKSNIEYIPLWSYYWRIFSDYVFRLFFPRKFIDRSNSLDQIVKAAHEGKGLIIVYTHFSFRDAMEVNRSIAFFQPELRKRYAINPLSFHQFNKPMEIMAKSYHGTFYPVVNNSTLKKEKYNHLPKGQGLKEFVNAGAQILKKGGTVSLAVNATRSEKLDMNDPQKPIGYFIAALQALRVHDYGVLLVCLSIENAKSYAKKDIGGMNFGKTIIINLVKYLPVDKLLNRPEVKGKLSNVDAYIRSEIAKTAPKEYL